MGFKESLNSNPITKRIFTFAKNKRDNTELKRRVTFKGQFINRSSGKEKLCIVLAGYKPYLYDIVFERLRRFISEDYDVCIVSSGKYDKTLEDICAKNQWSYLSTKENNVALVQNAAISLHPNAEYIFKIDEDIFLTKDYFEKMIEAYEEASVGNYKAGIIAPMIPINGFSHKLILERLNLEAQYEKLFEKPIFMAGPSRMIESSPDVAKFFWGQGNFIPQIDDLNNLFSDRKNELIPCPVRFSIGAILFKRELIDGMRYIPVYRWSSGLGLDEMDICAYCINHSRPIMVTTNTVVGHFSFGPQTKGMKEYYMEHPERFIIKE